MKNVCLFIVGLVGLSSCNSFPTEPEHQVIEIRLSPAALSQCGTVTWQDTALMWRSPSALKPGLGLVAYNGSGQEKVQLADSKVVLQYDQYVLTNYTGRALPDLNSVFTCSNSGETAEAAYHFRNSEDYRSQWATAIVDIVNGHLYSKWQTVYFQ